MYMVWFVVSVILGVVWIVAAVGITIACVSDEGVEGLTSDEYKTFTAIMAGLILVVFFHWIILIAAVVLIVPAFVIYGAVQGIKRPWRNLGNQ